MQITYKYNLNYQTTQYTRLLCKRSQYTIVSVIEVHVCMCVCMSEQDAAVAAYRHQTSVQLHLRVVN